VSTDYALVLVALVAVVFGVLLILKHYRSIGSSMQSSRSFLVGAVLVFWGAILAIVYIAHKSHTVPIYGGSWQRWAVGIGFIFVIATALAVSLFGGLAFLCFPDEYSRRLYDIGLVPRILQDNNRISAAQRLERRIVGAVFVAVAGFIIYLLWSAL